MKRLSIGIFGLMLVPAILVSSVLRTPPSTAAPAQTQYYWYSVPGDRYHDHTTLNTEMDLMWLYYGTIVDTNPSGGTMVEKGYPNNNYPHTTFPSVYLYAHF
ncbi:MAG: hypothetical protein J0H74_14590 [Chitinophagaceae bacterium]|nr:hypothetical protein [Chitinophagaceae bacterium]